MKRYLLFSGDVYYPGGGWNDFRGSFDTIHEAKKACEHKDDNYAWWHIIDNETGTIIEHDEFRMPDALI